MSGKRMNYGPHFRNTTVDVGFTYDYKVDKALHNAHMRMAAAYNAMPQYKKELYGYNIAMNNKKAMEKRRGGHEREAAEQRMVEAIRKVVEILEFHMEDMMQHRLVPGRQRYVHQAMIHNIISDLRNKCGVQFTPGGQYDHHLENPHLHAEPSDQELDLRAEQHAARERKMREIADRLIARPKTR